MFTLKIVVYIVVVSFVSVFTFGLLSSDPTFNSLKQQKNEDFWILWGGAIGIRFLIRRFSNASWLHLCYIDTGRLSEFDKKSLSNYEAYYPVSICLKSPKS